MTLVYGHRKQGARFGHTKIQGKSLLVRGLNALAAVVSTPLSAPVIAATRLRGGPPGPSPPRGQPGAPGDWLAGQEATAALVLGLFGASTGAAAALVAAAARPAQVRAVVSRGGRPDLAAQVLPRVHQPVLLIVGMKDPAVLELNRQAMQKLAGESQLAIVPGASHLFEEPGALEHVAQLARGWFLEHLT